MAKLACIGRNDAAADVQGSCGPSKAVADIAVEFRSALIAYFLKKTRSLDDSEDLVQEVFMRLLNRGSASGIAAPRNYVFQVASNVLVDWSRRNKARGAGAHDCLVEALPDHEQISCERRMLARERFEFTRMGLQELPEKTQSILMLRRLDGKKNSEIAREMGVSLSTVEKHIHHATAHLKSRLEEQLSSGSAAP